MVSPQTTGRRHQRALRSTGAPGGRAAPPVSDRVAHHQIPAATTTSTPQAASASRHPTASAIGTVNDSVSIEPTFSAAVYAPSTAPACPESSRPMTTGTATFATVIAAPISTVPARAVGRPPSDRTTIPASSTPRATSTPRPNPSLASNAEAAGVASPKQSTGRLVRRPAVPPLMPRSARITSVTGETATIGPRMLSARSRIAATSSAGAAARRGVVGAEVTGLMLPRRDGTFTPS